MTDYLELLLPSEELEEGEEPELRSMLRPDAIRELWPGETLDSMGGGGEELSALLSHPGDGEKAEKESVLPSAGAGREGIQESAPRQSGTGEAGSLYEQVRRLYRGAADAQARRENFAGDAPEAHAGAAGADFLQGAESGGVLPRLAQLRDASRRARRMEQDGGPEERARFLPLRGENQREQADLVQLVDAAFQRDARRYDSGFELL